MGQQLNTARAEIDILIGQARHIERFDPSRSLWRLAMSLSTIDGHEAHERSQIAFKRPVRDLGNHTWRKHHHKERP